MLNYLAFIAEEESKLLKNIAHPIFWNVVSHDKKELEGLALENWMLVGGVLIKFIEDEV